MIEGENNLIDAAQKGDRKSFDELYTHYVSPIYRFIYMKVARKDEAEDLTHDVFLSAWQNLAGYKPRGFPFSSWLYRIARNRVIDFYRLQKPTTDIETADAEFIKIDARLEEVVDHRLAIENVRDALQALTPDQQDVLLMKFMEDLSHAEIAAALEKSEGAIRIIQHRAINELKRLLDNETNLL